MQLFPSRLAALTSSFVVLLISPFDNSAITIVSVIFSPQIMLASSLSNCATVWAELAPSNFLPAGFAGGITWETTVTLAAGGLTALTSTCAFFAIMIPLTFDFLTLIEPLSQLTTAGRFSETIASPPSVGSDLTPSARRTTPSS